MKKLDIKKAKSQILGLLLAVFVIIGSIMLGAISTATEEAESSLDTSKISGTVDFTLGKYVNYNIQNQKGAIVELDVKTGLKFEEGEPNVDLKTSGLIINSPKINNEFAKTVEIVNGKLVNYDATTGIIKASSDKENIKVILDFGENCYIEKSVEEQNNSNQNNQNAQNTQKPQLMLKGILYSQLDVEKETIISSNFENTVELEEKSGLISSEVSTTPIYNGFIKNKLATKYQENYDINISKKELGNETIFEINNGYGIDKVTYLSSMMVKSNIIDILGNTGSLTIIDEQGNIIAKVDNNTQVDEKGIFKVSYPQNVSKLFIKITKPVKVGKIRIQNEKQIPAEVNDKTIKNIETLSKISVVNKKEIKEQVVDKQTNQTTTQTKIEETVIYNYQEKASIEVKESATQVNLKVEDDKYTWTNERQNELNFTLELPISSNKYNLFKNPNIEIKLPEEVEKVVLDENILKKATVMYANGLELKAINYNAENKTIRVALEGEQKEYINSNIANGTTITFPAIVILGQEINSKEANINVNYSNYLAFDNDAIEQGNTVTKVNLVNFKEALNQEQTKAELQEQVDKSLLANRNISTTTQAIRQNPRSTLTETEQSNNEDGLIDSNVQEKPYKITLTSRKHGLVEYNYIYDLKIEGKIQETSTVKVKLPDCMELDSFHKSEEAPYLPEVIESTNTVIFEIQPEENVEEYNYVIETVVNLNKVYSNPEYSGKTEIELKTIAILNDKYKSNENITIVPIKKIVVTMSSPTAGEKIKKGDEVKYNINVKSEGKSDYSVDGLDYTLVNLLVNTPEEIGNVTAKYNNWEIIYNDKDNEENTEEDEVITINKIENNIQEFNAIRINESGERIANVVIPLLIPYKEEVNVTITGIAGKVDKDKEITAYAVGSNNFGEWKLENHEGDNNLTSDIIENVNVDVTRFVSHILLADVKEAERDEETMDPEDEIIEHEEEYIEPVIIDGEEDNYSPEQNKYSITGIIWDDKNENGIKDESESIISDVETILFDNNYNIINKGKTDKNGTYVISDLSEGKYIIVYIYDTNNYTLSKNNKIGNINIYQTTKVVEDKEIVCGSTELLDINKDYKDINVGLVKNKKFDFMVENYISKIITSKGDNTEDKNYDNSKLAKIEIKSKELDGTKVTIEYKIKITNIGELAGTVGEIIDYIPNGLYFPASENSNWINNLDGTITNKSIATSVIEPGESVEVTLVLTKDMTENSTGTFKNRVAINNVSNTLNIKEESTENNNDYSEVIISIGTGIAISITITLVVIISVIIFLNYKFSIFKTIKFRLFGMLLVSIIVAIGYGNIGVKADIEYEGTDRYYTEYRWFMLTGRTGNSYIFGDEGARWRRTYNENTVLDYNLIYVKYNGNSMAPSNDGPYYIKMSSEKISAALTDSIMLTSQSGVGYLLNVYKSDGSLRKTYQLSSLGVDDISSFEKWYVQNGGAYGQKINLKNNTNSEKFLYRKNDWRLAVYNQSGYPEAALCIDDVRDPSYDWAKYIQGASGNTIVFDGAREGGTYNTFPAQQYKLQCNNDGTLNCFANTSDIITTITQEQNNYSVEAKSNDIKYNTKTVNGVEYYVFGPIALKTNKEETAKIDATGGAVLNDYYSLQRCHSDGTIYGDGTGSYNLHKDEYFDYYFRISKSLFNGNINKITIKTWANSTAKEWYQSKRKTEVIWQNVNNKYLQRFKTKENVNIKIGGGIIGCNLDIGIVSKPSSLKIIKVDNTSNTKKLDGIQFELYDVTEGKWVGVERVNANTCKYNGYYNDYRSDTTPAKINGSYTYARIFETNNNGETVTINNLPSNHQYRIYEISLGSYSDLYDLGTFTWNGTHDGKQITNNDIINNIDGTSKNYSINTINNTISFTSDKLATVTINNKPNKVKVKIKKNDLSNNNRIDGITFKILDVAENKWVKVVKKDGNYYYNGTTSSYSLNVPLNNIWNNNNEYSAFLTNKNGETVTIVGLPKKNYKFYEVDVGEYSQYFHLDTFVYNSQTKKGKLVAEKNYSNETSQSVITVEANNTINTTQLKIVKKDTISTTKLLNGIRFKILDVNNNQWVQVKRNGDDFIYNGETTTYNTRAVSGDAWKDTYTYSTFMTNNSGETVLIKGLPAEHKYKIYEVSLGAFKDIYTLGTFSFNGIEQEGLLLKSTSSNEEPYASVENGNLSDEGELTPNLNTTVTVNAFNKATKTKLKIIKQDDTGKRMAGIKFKILNTVTKKWVRFAYDSTDKVFRYSGEDKETEQYFDSVPASIDLWKNNYAGNQYATFATYNINGTLDTNIEGGETVELVGLPLKYTYRIFELEKDNPYKDYYSFSHFTHKGAEFNAIRLNPNNTTLNHGSDYRGSNIDTSDSSNPDRFTFVAEPDNLIEVKMTNRATTSFKIVKQNEAGQKLSGFKFKVLHVNTNKWLQFEYDYSNNKFIVCKNSNGSQNELDVYQDTTTPPSEVGWKNIPQRYAMKFSTLMTYEQGSTVTIEGLTMGPGHIYRIYEVGIPDQYKNDYELQEHLYRNTTFKAILANNSNSIITPNKVIEDNGNFIPLIQNNSVFTFTMTNKTTSSFKIKKIDKDTKEPLQGIRFKILDVQDNKWVSVQYNGINYNYTGTVDDYNKEDVTEKKEDTTYSTFVTDSNGETITIIGIPTEGKTYKLYEVDLPDDYNGKYELGVFKYKGVNYEGKIAEIDNSLTSGISRNSNETFAIQDKAKAVVTAVNEKVETGITLSGFVWNEGRDGKIDKVINGIYDSNSSDKLLPGIKVYLKEEGKQDPIAVTNTDNYGNYSFSNLDRNKMDKYSVEFEYNGYDYQALSPDTTISNPPAQNTSKAKENETSRKTLNNKGINITKHSNTDDVSNNLTATIQASMIKSYYDKIKDTDTNEIIYMNLGLYERPKLDLSLIKDLTKAVVKVNGEEFTYKFDNKTTKISELINIMGRTEQSEPNTMIGLLVGTINDITEQTSYSLPIFKADVKYSNDPNTPQDNKLKVTLEYRIALSNDSSLYAEVNSLNEFFSTNMNIEEKVYDNDGNEIGSIFDEINGENIQNQNIQGYKHYIINFNNGIKIAPYSTRYVFVRFALPEDYFKNKEVYANEQFRNYAEISKYSVYSDNRLTPYYAYDVDSEPNNLINGKFEDDDDKEPGIKLLDAGKRNISGTVFEDLTERVENGQSIGDSKFDKGKENVIKNVKVQLLDKDGNQAYYVKMNRFGILVRTPIETMSDENGDYKFEDIPAGEYIVKFIWGEGENSIIKTKQGTEKPVKIDKYNSTPWSQDNKDEKDYFNDETQIYNWYMYSTPRFSDAEDKVTNTNTIEAITLENKLIKISPSYVLTDEYKLSPDTGIIDYVLNIENIDFGLIKKQSSTIEINKRVKHIKISAGDLTLVDAEVNDDKTGFKNADDVLLSTYLPPSKSAPFGMIQTAIDGVYPLNLEVQYEISVKGENLTDEVKQNIKIFDYLDSKYGSVKENLGYELLTKDKTVDNINSYTEILNASNIINTAMEINYDIYMKNTQLAYSDVIRAIYDGWTNIINKENALANKNNVNAASEAKLYNKKVYELTSLENDFKNSNATNINASYTYTALSTIANNKDNINFVNDVEVVGVEADDNNPLENLYDRAEEIIITPPYGENKNLPNAIIISIVALGTVLVVLIGKKLIKKKTN